MIPEVEHLRAGQGERLVRGDDHHPASRTAGGDQLLDQRRARGIETVERFVEQPVISPLPEQPGEPCALALPGREEPHRHIGQFSQSQLGERKVVRAIKFAPEFERMTKRQMLIERQLGIKVSHAAVPV